MGSKNMKEKAMHHAFTERRAKTVLWVVGFMSLYLANSQAEAARPPRPTVTLVSPVTGATVTSPILLTATVAGGTAPYTYDWRIPRGSPARFTTTTTLTQNGFSSNHAAGRVRITLIVRDANHRRGVARATVTVQRADPGKSINSTSDSREAPPTSPVPELSNVSGGYQVFAVNDLGMHCGDLDHRKVSILPPFNVLHGQLVAKGNAQTLPEIMTAAQLAALPNAVQGDGLYYSAASNPADPALAGAAATPVFKTNFWDINVASNTGNRVLYDGYAAFYPPNTTPDFLALLAATGTDVGLPTPDLEQFYLNNSTLVIDQQAMPGVAAPYDLTNGNVRQAFKRFNADYPFFINPNANIGYTLFGVNWFLADGIPIAPTDDFGRRNAYPLLRVDAQVGGAQVTSHRTVAPVSGEADCYRCHTSAADGGTGAAACLPAVDANCTNPLLSGGSGSPRSGTPFAVAQSTQDPQFGQPLVPADVSREWAADVNVLRLHDAKHNTSLDTATPPVVCQRCHYSPALDLAHFGPLGPADPAANGRDQRVHRSNSRVLHAFHSQFTDLFANDMPPPDSPLRSGNTGRPVVNAFVLGKLNESCYQCHPGRDTKCLRGAMFNGGMICQDCHGNMAQVGNDFSQNFPTSPYPAGANLQRRIPWANEPACQSCHSGDAASNLAGTAGTIASSDGIRLLQAYLTTNNEATPIESPNSRFAENLANGKRVLYRLSTGHGGVACQVCHGSTHAEWPVQPESGTTIANDNMAAIDIQGHAGKITECAVCHGANGAPLGLDGPHGMHPVDQRWVSGHESFLGGQGGSAAARTLCGPCHGLNGQGTVLAEVAIARTFAAEDRGNVALTKGRQVTCGICHGNPL